MDLETRLRAFIAAACHVVVGCRRATLSRMCLTNDVMYILIEDFIAQIIEGFQ